MLDLTRLRLLDEFARTDVTLVIGASVTGPAEFAQAYRLAFWRVAGEELNYRRFFDINELAAIRTETSKLSAVPTVL